MLFISKILPKINTINKIQLLLIILFFFSFLNFLHSKSSEADLYELSFQELSKIKISSASKVSENINEIQSTVYVVTKEKIKAKGYLSIDEVLSEIPGFQFRNIQGFNSYIFQRGIPNQNNLILLLIDGVQINELNSGGFYGGFQYNLSNVERIEIISGPASMVYGTNAVTGIVNIITKSALTNEFEINASAGSFNTINADFNYSFTNEDRDFGIRVAAMAKQTDKTDLKGEAGDNNWTDLMENFEKDYSADLKVNWKNFTFGTNFINKKTTMATNEKSVEKNLKDFGTLWNIQFINNYLRYNNKFSDNLELNSTLYNRNATVLDNSIYYVLDTAQVGCYRPNNLTGIENIVNYNVTDFLSVVGGLTFEYEQLAKNFSYSYSNSMYEKPEAPSKPEMEHNYLTSVFIEPKINISNSLYLSSGLRYDNSSVYDQVLTPSAGISYNYLNQRIRFSYSEAFRAPKPWDYTNGLGNPGLEPERMRVFEAALNLSITDNYKFDIVAYKNNFKNAITKENIDDSYRWTNEGEINTLGFELYLKAAHESFSYSLNYSFTESKNQDDKYIPEISKHTANASFTYYFNEGISLNLRANYVGERENPVLISSTNSKTIDQFIIFHSTLSVMILKGCAVQLIARNILDTKYYHTSNRPPSRYKQAERSLLLSVSYSYNE
ncbi:MAG TPA: TonB-dependent receptor [Candidatus Kapabacteria bacterium]|nr:TonB-dependent receptor [Candidatus Kapabacteria bacterium]HPO63280.1 TonB-dependent receptor [Candidatus Kapabacteria bacterium]